MLARLLLGVIDICMCNGVRKSIRKSPVEMLTIVGFTFCHDVTPISINLSYSKRVAIEKLDPAQQHGQLPATSSQLDEIWYLLYWRNSYQAEQLAQQPVLRSLLLLVTTLCLFPSSLAMVCVSLAISSTVVATVQHLQTYKTETKWLQSIRQKDEARLVTRNQSEVDENIDELWQKKRGYRYVYTYVCHRYYATAG